MEDELLSAFEAALDDVREGVVTRYVSRATEFVAVDPGELFSDTDWVNAMVAGGVPEAVALNIVAEAAATFGFTEILAAGFDDISIAVTFEGPIITTNVVGLKPQFQQVVTEHVESLTGYSNTIRNTVEETVTTGIARGTSVDDIAIQLSDSGELGDVSARAFAQTETIAGSNGSAYAGYPNDAKKQWLYTHDSRVRKSHEEAGKQEPIQMDALFVVGDGTARYPGDPYLPIGERVWCRCTLAPVLGSLDGGLDSIEFEFGTRDNLPSAETRTRFDMSDKKTITLTINKTEELADAPGTEAVDLSKATRNCGANSTGSCCDDCAESTEESFTTEGAATFEEEDTEEARPFDWEGVLTVEGLPSGDGRAIAENALEWRDLPIPLMLQTKNASGHSGAEIAGSIVEIERVGNKIIGRGYFDSGEVGQEFKRLIEEGTMAGVSVDLDLVISEFRDTNGKTLNNIEEVVGVLNETGDPFSVLETVIQGRIMGATGTPFPAFQEAQLELLDAAVVASLDTPSKLVLRVHNLVASNAKGWTAANPEPAALVASAGFPEVPDVAWFNIEDDGDVADFPPFTVYPDGRVFGVVAEYGSCHLGSPDRCVTVPKPWDGFAHACNKTTLTTDGLVATASIYMDTVHPDLAASASDAQTWYADTGAAVADVMLWDTPRGIVAAGAMRPDVSAADLRAFRGSDVSPDWRQIKGNLTMVGLLAVNVSGFVVERDQVLVASAGSPAELMVRGRYEDGEVTALVAAGVPPRPSRLAELEALSADMVHKYNLLTAHLGVDVNEEQTNDEATAFTISIPKKAAGGVTLSTRPSDKTVTLTRRGGKVFASNNAIHESLYKALEARFTGWIWVRDFDLETGIVIFELETNDDWVILSLGFTLDGEKATLSADQPVEVEVKLSYEPTS